MITSGHVTKIAKRHSIRHIQKLHAASKLHGSIEPELLLIEVLHCGGGWRSGSALVSINEVNVRRARLVHDRVRVQFPVPAIYLGM